MPLCGRRAVTATVRLGDPSAASAMPCVRACRGLTARASWQQRPGGAVTTRSHPAVHSVPRTRRSHSESVCPLTSFPPSPLANSISLLLLLLRLFWVPRAGELRQVHVCVSGASHAAWSPPGSSCGRRDRAPLFLGLDDRPSRAQASSPPSAPRRQAPLLPGLRELRCVSTRVGVPSRLPPPCLGRTTQKSGCWLYF